MIDKLLLTLVGAVIGWLLNHQKSISSENANIINEHIEDIKAFSDVLQEYWLSENSNLTDEKRAAAKVRAHQVALNSFYGEAPERLSTKRCREYQVQHLRLFNVGLGGAFETHSRKFDAERAIESYELTSILIHTLRLARKEQLSVWIWLKNLSEKIGF